MSGISYLVFLNNCGLNIDWPGPHVLGIWPGKMMGYQELITLNLRFNKMYIGKKFFLYLLIGYTSLHGIPKSFDK